MKERKASDLILVEDAITEVHLLGTASAGPEFSATLSVALKLIVRGTESLDLTQTAILAKRMLSTANSTTHDELLEKAAILKERWQDELESVKLLELSHEESEQYNSASDGFGERVSEAFPSASYDCGEAIRCMALGRNTAAVLHCMRALEFPLQAMSIALKVAPKQAAWKSTIATLQTAFDAIEKMPNIQKPKGWQKTLKQFYSEAFTHFFHLKDSWRNHAMHAGVVYAPEDAEKIVAHTRHFMQHLATRLKSKKRNKY